MTNRKAIEKAIALLRAAGDDDGADDLVAELAELDSVPDETPPAVVVVVETESATGDGAAALDSLPAVADELAVIAAHAAADVERIEATAAATAAAEIAVLEARAEIEAPTEVVAEVVAPADPDPDPEPRTAHWYYRPL